VPPRTRTTDDLDREDRLQDYKETSTRLRDASPRAIKRITDARTRERESRDKRQIDPRLSREQLIELAAWKAMQESEGGEDAMNLRIDLENAMDRACEHFPEPVVLAAMEDLAAEQYRESGMRKATFYEQVESARGFLREQLKDYHFK